MVGLVILYSLMGLTNIIIYGVKPLIINFFGGESDSLRFVLSELYVYYIIKLNLNCISISLFGIIRAIGKDLQGTKYLIFYNFCLGLIIELILGFYFKLNLKGVLIGASFGYVFGIISLLILIFDTDWTFQAKKIHRLAKKKIEK
jgi:Na+-driven multidrug efflux pump